MKNDILRTPLISGLLLMFVLSFETNMNAENPLKIPAVSAENIHQRGSYQNSKQKFESEKTGHVAFLGGSITEMNGYRPMVCAFLEKTFPETKFQFTNAGISSTCSNTGAFRTRRDVLSQGPVDLFFVEFAVNDDQDAGHSETAAIRGMEGVIAQIRRHNPYADIVMVHFINPSMLETIQQKKKPLSSSSHERVAAHYEISTIDLASEVARLIDAKQLTWEQFGGTHPAPFGNAICAAMIDKLLTNAWQKQGPRMKHASPQEPLDPFSFRNGRLIEIKNAKLNSGWTIEVPEWDSIPGSKRSRFTSIPMLCATTAGAELELAFEGTALGVFTVAGPDAGILEVSIDAGPFQPFDLYHNYSKGLHYPRSVVFDSQLKPGKHHAKIRLSEKSSGKGHAARIMYFVGN
ncbi:SGNH/GDSL hydrolase family protein [uncultured Gimesia sp.]|uniref:SGNH/GDSL hydrolase family protein n=1 Tax=uncultured Gimesia sp. TaxID=1678688 RepID=UPI002624A471|nr:SGNH/GDSL hydrolase family protein [uncultured Gimesia sp.]